MPPRRRYEVGRPTTGAHRRFVQNGGHLLEGDGFGLGVEKRHARLPLANCRLRKVSRRLAQLARGRVGLPIHAFARASLVNRGGEHIVHAGVVASRRLLTQPQIQGVRILSGELGHCLDAEQLQVGKRGWANIAEQSRAEEGVLFVHASC